MLGLKSGWEEVAITLIKGSSSVSIESVQKSAEQVEGGGREGAAGHEVERNDGEDNPGITLGWHEGDRQDGSRSLPKGPHPPVRPRAAREQHSPMRLGTNRKIFSLAIAAAPLPPGPNPEVPALSQPHRAASPSGRAPGPRQLSTGPRYPSPAPDVKARCRPE